MARYETLMQLGNNIWKGYRLLVIDEVPSHIHPSFLPEVLSRSRKRFLTVELCVFTGEDRYRLSVGVVLRYQSKNRYEVEGVLNDLSFALIAQFKESGFSIHLAESDDIVCQSIMSRFEQGYGHGCSAIGFFPMEQVLGPKHFYVPGQYSSENCLPIEWDRLSELLTRYPMSCMCLQLCNTLLFPAEIQCLQENKLYFSAFLNDPYARSAGRVFERLFNQIDQPLLYVNINCIGSVPFLEDVTAQMSLWHYSHYMLPYGALNNPYYLLTGDEEMARFSMTVGHADQCPNHLAKSQRMQRLTHMASLEDVAKLLPLPTQAAAVSGLRVKRALSSPVQIPPSSVYREGNKMLYLGEQEETHTALGVSINNLVRHGFIVGKSGSGKTTFAMGMLHQLHQQGIPFLVIEPTKKEYRQLLHKIDNLQVYTPGLDSVSPMMLNLFLPPKGITVQEYLPTLTTIFEAVIAMDHPLDVIFPQVIRECYIRHGWRLTSTQDSKGARPFGMSEFIQCFQHFIRKQYAKSPEALGNLESAGVVRLTQLITEHPVLFDTINSVDIDDLLRQPTIVELDAIDNEKQKCLIMLIILAQAMLSIRHNAALDSGLNRMILVDEAHLLLGNDQTKVQNEAADPDSACIRFVQNMVKILRSTGTGIFFGDQSAFELTKKIMEHVNVKIMFRQESSDERAVLGQLTRMDNTMQEDMIDLPPGYGYVFLDQDLDKPVRLYTPDYKRTLELQNLVTHQDVIKRMRQSLPPPFTQCTHCTECNGNCDIALRMDAFFIASRLMADDISIVDILQQEHPEPALKALLTSTLPAAVEVAIREQDLPWHNKRRLTNCAAIQLIRAFRLHGQHSIQDEELLSMISLPIQPTPPPIQPRSSKNYINPDLAAFTEILEEDIAAKNYT